VNIAILDTGIDVSHPLLRDKIVIEDCWDFVNNSASICDEVGHGTHTASLLAKTAPRARIFCGRVWRKRTEDENTGRLVAEAIIHAVDKWKVHIIVMPFAFPHRNQDIADAVDHAHSKKVLLFSAASNKSDLGLGFPAYLPEVICIYSNKASTIPSTFCKLGKERRNNFSTIGEEVEGAWPLHLNNGKETKRETGTSCSTPIAAGVAALILEYA
ncbi:subtilisin-like protein, partial [Lepidopterella palustris CBS 459.81]